MSKTNFDEILDKVQSRLSKPAVSESKEEQKPESKIESEQEEDVNKDESNVDIEENKDEEVKKPESKKSDEENPDLEKKVKSLEKALNDTKKSYQDKNQRLIIAKKNFNKLIDELKEDQLSENNVLVEKDQYENIISRLRAVFDIKEDEIDLDQEVKESENKGKNIISKLESEFEVYKKYNKGKDLDTNYKAFFESIHLFNVDERQSVLEYLEEAESSDAIEKVLLLGQDYRNIFEKGLKKHKNLFAFVGSLQDEISKLNEEINKYKESVDSSYDKEDNKQIKSRSSGIVEKGKKYDDHIIGLLNMRNRHN